MTQVTNYQIKVTGAALAAAIREFTGGGPRTAGMEMERFVLRADGTLPDAAAHDALYLALRQSLGDLASVEPGAHMIEIKTGVHTGGLSLTTEFNETVTTLKKTAALQGLRITGTSDPPSDDSAALVNNRISRIDPETGKVRRQHEILKAYEKNGWNELLHYGSRTVSIQLTHAVTDAERLYRWFKVHAALMPLYYAVTENRTRGADGVHEALRLRREMGDRCLLPDYLFSARNASDFIGKYVDFVLRSPMLIMLGPDGEDKVLPAPQTFTGLPPESQTLGNLLQAASLSWHVCKIKPVIDDAALQTGNVRLKNLLLEVRDMDSSDAAIPAVAGWFCALTASEETLNEAEARLEALGVPVSSDPVLAGRRTEAALRAVETGPGCLQTPFGDPARGTVLRDALTQLVLPILKESGGAATLSLWEAAARADGPPFRVKSPASPPPLPPSPGLHPVP